MQSSAKQACAWAVAGGEDVLGSQMLKALLSHLIGTAGVVMICGKVPPPNLSLFLVSSDLL